MKIIFKIYIQKFSQIIIMIKNGEIWNYWMIKIILVYLQMENNIY